MFLKEKKKHALIYCIVNNSTFSVILLFQAYVNDLKVTGELKQLFWMLVCLGKRTRNSTNEYGLAQQCLWAIAVPS